MSLFKKNKVVGVSVTLERGLEVAEIDYTTKTLLKYATQPLEYNVNQRQIADMDIFKNTLQDLLTELQIPKGTDLIINLPTVFFKITDFQASLDEMQVSSAIEEELVDVECFSNDEAVFSAELLSNSTLQFNKVAYTAAQKNVIYEIILAVKDLGYRVNTITSSVNSTLTALMYLDRVNKDADNTWVLMVVENNCCRIISMNGANYVDSFEDNISIGEVLGDAENYSIIINSAEPVLKNLPSNYLCVVSKTNLISAEILANKLTYSAPITYQEMNNYAKETLLEYAPSVDSDIAKNVSLDVIGAAISQDYSEQMCAHFNLYNKSLGAIFTDEQPPEIAVAGRIIKLTNEFLIIAFLILAAVIALPSTIASFILSSELNTKQAEYDRIHADIEQMKRFLKENENISAELFDEGDEIRQGLTHNKNIYTYYTLVGTEIPKKLWLTYMLLDDKVTIDGQADNLESIYGFFRNLKDYGQNSDIKIQKLGLANNNSSSLSGDGSFDTDSILTTMNADFYEFRISNKADTESEDKNKSNPLPELEPIKE